jgi:Bacterial Ig domain/WD40-like Beta Propeller Repeat
MRRFVLTSAVTLLVVVSVPAVSSATSIPGPAGKIAFTSGRPSNGVPAPNLGDAGARIFVADFPSGTPVQVTTLPEGAAVRHRQPNWSPDHSRIAYAAGSGTVFALWILDLRTGSQTQIVPPTIGLDRPSWSPDGAQIAYGAEGDLWVKGMEPETAPVAVTNNVGTTEERPVWSPDGNTLYYDRGLFPFETGIKRDIYKISPIDADSLETQITSGESDDWQPSVSPDGKTLCFLRGPAPLSDKSTIQLVGVNGGLLTPFSNSTGGSINCVWSPDGSQILYTQGTFGAGDLALRDTSGNIQSVPESWKAKEHFDGNADWATNFSPKCDSKLAQIGVNQFTTINLSCTDPDSGFGAEPPTPTPLESDAMEIAMGPSHGTIGGLSDGKVIYTPNKDFQGADAFTYTGTDGTSNALPASVTIQVGNPQAAAGDHTPPTISAVKASVKRWRLGNSLAKISKAPVGTTISFTLSEAARSTLTFQSAKAGRKSGKNCVKQTSTNKTRPSCTRYVNAGSINLNAKAGQNKVRFQGLLTKTRKLSLGSYRVVVGARDAAGNKASRNGPTFTIVQG